MTKKHVTIGFILLTSVFILMSCGKKEASPYYIEATIDGVTYRQSDYTEGKHLNNFGTQLYASDSPEHKMQNINKWYIAVNGNTAGDYLKAKVIIKYYKGPTEFYEHNQGITGTDSTVKFTSYGTVGETIEGTFSGELNYTGDSNRHSLTNGSFKLKRNPDM